MNEVIKEAFNRAIKDCLLADNDLDRRLYAEEISKLWKEIERKSGDEHDDVR